MSDLLLLWPLEINDWRESQERRKSVYKLTRDMILASKKRPLTHSSNAMMQEERNNILEFLTSAISLVEK